MEKEGNETIEEFGSISALHKKVSHGQNKTKPLIFSAAHFFYSPLFELFGQTFGQLATKLTKKQGEEQLKENSFLILLYWQSLCICILIGCMAEAHPPHPPKL
jgi:hypothetical protein